MKRITIPATALFFINLFTMVYGISIADKGAARAVIIIAKNAPDMVRYAAVELQTYLGQVTGADFVIANEPQEGLGRIFIGQNPFTDALNLSTDELPADGFIIRSGDNWIAILGRDYSGPPIYTSQSPFHYDQVYNENLKLGAFGETGSLYGVYRFLEDVCGIRWYMPGELGEIVPRQDTVNVDNINLTAAPHFEYRYTMLCDFARSAADARWYRRLGYGAAYPAQITHSFWTFWDKYRTTHPEYFAIIAGQRDISNLSTATGMGNLCLSNPAVKAQWIADINDYFDQNPQQFICPVAPDDGMVKICECSECQAQLSPELGEGGIFSNYVWSFVNEVAAAVAVKHPGKFVDCFAYENFRQPPSVIDTPHPNLAVMVCKPINPGPNTREKTEALINQWRQKTAHNLYLYDYYLYSWRPWRNLPIAFPHQIAADLKAVQTFCKGAFIEAQSSEYAAPPQIVQLPGMAHLNLYVTARLLWNPNLDVNALLDDYYVKFYGPARDSMKKFWTLAETIWISKSSLGDPLKIYSAADLNELSLCLDQALAQTIPDTAYRKRVELIQSEYLPGMRKLTHPLILNPPQVSLPKLAVEIKLEAPLDDRIWQSLNPSGFVDCDGEPAKFPTRAYAAWDEKNIYFTFVNEEPEMEKLTTLATQRDQNYGPGMWDDDCIEIFICPDSANREKKIQFIINAKGLIWDSMKESKTAPLDVSWNSCAQTHASLDSGRWTLKVQIPLADIGIAPPAENKSIAVNFYRTRRCGPSYVFSCWSPTLIFQHDAPERFGTIIFTKK